MDIYSEGPTPGKPDEPHGDRKDAPPDQQSKPTEGGRELDPLAVELYRTRLPATTDRLVENELYQIHISYCWHLGWRSGGISQRPSSEIERRVFDKLKKAFQVYVRRLSADLDETLPEHRMLKVPRVGGIYTPRWYNEWEGSSKSRWHRSTDIERIITRRDGKKQYMLLARVTNSQGDPIVCFDRFVTRHAEERADPTIQDRLDVIRYPTLTRVSRVFSAEEESAYIDRPLSNDFVVAPIFSPQSFAFELRELAVGKAQSFLGSRTRPYLATVILHAIASKSGSPGDIEGIQIFALEPLSRDKPGAFWVDSSRGAFNVWLYHDTPAFLAGTNSWQATFYVERAGESPIV